MQIIIKADSDTGTKQLTFSNECLSSLNFVEMIIGENSYIINLLDLCVICTSFERIKND